jgi:ATP-binding cassette subfamily C (CFTR/MRP) protein 4
VLFFAGMSTGQVGLSVTQLIVLNTTFQYLMKCWNDLDYQMTSVKRVVEYTDITPEPFGGTFTPPESWPSEGNVAFSSVSMRYSLDKPLVLKEVNFTVKSGEKIGIVGRTGAGKSSLISALFRLYDFEGTIFIDGLDTKAVPLHTLRSKIAIIPQEPVLFLGTLRRNLDPFDEYEDSYLWNALEDVEMKNFVSGLPSGLRLTIAHRTNTVMDSDKIVVMDSGNLVEFGNIEDLLQKPDGYFSGFVLNK